MATHTDATIEKSYQAAKDRFAEFDVDTEDAIEALASIPISLHCWQGDDVGGFESADGLSGGGIMATGNYHGKARSPDELRQDLEMVYAMLPSKHRLNLHAMYGEFGGKVPERTEIAPEHFTGWIDWAKAQGIGLDFNQTFFSHPKADDGFTITSKDKGIRDFWIEHGKVCRRIGEVMGRELDNPTITNLWIPDGFKDITIDRAAPRIRLKESLDEIFSEDLDPTCHKDAVECKLFGIGSEACVFGSHEFYLGYALTNNILLCLDAGHFHPTEVISDKISSVLTYLDEILLHVSRGVRWDSDHVVLLTDELQAIAHEIVRNDYLERVHIGLDFFDASINRVAAWIIGTRCMLKALMIALLEPTEMLRALENDNNFTERLAMLEEIKTMPAGAVWDYYCMKQGVPAGPDWIKEVKSYEDDVLSKR